MTCIATAKAACVVWYLSCGICLRRFCPTCPPALWRRLLRAAMLFGSFKYMYLPYLEFILIFLSQIFLDSNIPSYFHFSTLISCLKGLNLSNVPLFEQVYKRRDISAQIVRRAEKNGYKAIVLTADTPRLGRREADIKNKLISSPIFLWLFLHVLQFVL